MIQESWKMTETLAHGYSSESTQQELSNEYQHNRVSMIFKNLFILVLWTKVTSVLEGLKWINGKLGLFRKAVSTRNLSKILSKRSLPLMNFICFLQYISFFFYSKANCWPPKMFLEENIWINTNWALFLYLLSKCGNSKGNANRIITIQ